MRSGCSRSSSMSKAIELLETTANALLRLELLGTLVDEQRQAIEARYLEERGYAEIAGELRCSESVIRKRASRGLVALRTSERKGRGVMSDPIGDLKHELLSRRGAPTPPRCRACREENGCERCRAGFGSSWPRRRC